MWRPARATLSAFLFAALSACSSPAPGGSGAQPLAPADVPSDGPLSLLLAGDISFHGPIETADARAMIDLVSSATLAFANLEVNLLDAERATEAELRPAPRWVFGASRQARDLRQFGFDLVSLANNHATDFGAAGLASTGAALDAAGVLHAGAGSDLASARAAAVAGRGARRVALVAISASASPEARASKSQPGIKGRPGVNALGYEADITADGPTFETLKQAVVQIDAGPPPTDRELTMFGTRIRKGDRTHVAFTVNEADRQGLVDAVRSARAEAAIVVVSLHSHEPLNASDEAAEFIQRVAHEAIDAGASVVVGHGPHRLRGLELYKGAPIFYSLGNFLYQEAGLDFRAADAFDAGRDLYGALLGTPTPATPPERQLENEEWWQGAVARLVFGGGGLETVRIYPVDLAGGLAAGKRGSPRLATGERGSAILRRFSALSGAASAAGLRLDAAGGWLELPLSQIR